MLKLLLCCVFAVAAADPQWLVPSLYSHSVITPSTTTIMRQTSSVSNTPYLVVYDHLIKKREAPLFGDYLGQYWNIPYAVPNVYSSPALVQASVLTATQLIKKRALLAPTYISSYSSYIPPGVTDYLNLFHDASYPLVSVYSPPHFIKKRSAARTAPSTYLASTSYTAPTPLAATYSSAVLPSSSFWPYAAGFPFYKK